jgi:hypothetical protein
VRVQTQEIADLAVTAMAHSRSFESSVEAALSFVQKAEEQDDACLQLVGGCLEVGSGADFMAGLSMLPHQGLLTSLSCLLAEIDEACALAATRDVAAADELEQGVLGFDLQNDLELGGGVARVGSLDEDSSRVEEIPESAETHALEGP